MLLLKILVPFWSQIRISFFGAKREASKVKAVVGTETSFLGCFPEITVGLIKILPYLLSRYSEVF